ncbi:hypothetical protein [Streptomyces sp. CB01881]|uniref:DUF3885 domain-containing protein n=1 Tax=Streptomyces sp. CB01881 TaxID=2078691 RepID=UPI001F11FED1|nr:hypothetical protein [Streptomyces sp. CB01881]
MSLPRLVRDAQPELTALWQSRWPASPPVGHMVSNPYWEVWVRFHSLPKSKRYPGDEGEYAIVLERYNTVLDELFAGRDVHVVTSKWTTGPDAPRHRPRAGYWQTLLMSDDPNPKFRTYQHLYAVRRAWQRGCLDGLLRAVANDVAADVLITDTELERIHHPYDGGADVLLTSTEERDRLRERHADWLSKHPQGL